MASTASQKPSSYVLYSNNSTSSPNQFAYAPASSRTPWDVFLSFHGKDTRDNIISHLYSALDCHGIQTYIDDPELRNGEAVSDALIKAIGDSKIYVVVFSENYASSSWCLDELVEIYKCHETKKRQIISMYYNIDPSIVRHQSGSFKKAFKNHEAHPKSGFFKKLSWREHQLGSEVQMEKIAKWRLALTEIAGFTGKSIPRSEIDIINKVVERILLEIKPMNMHVAQYPVGLETGVEKITELISRYTEGVASIGIYGMGGVGKTSLAKAVYNQNYHSFQGGCFLANVRENSKTERGLVLLQQQLINDVLKCKNIIIDNIDQGIELIRAKLRSTKVLIVVDDLDNLMPMKFLKGTFALGSIIIITTRNEDLLDSLKVEVTYKVKELGDAESHQLFTQHAFQDNNMSETFANLSKEIIEHAGGLPLALNIFGSMLFKQSEEQWRQLLHTMKQNSIDAVEEKLMISFDALKFVDPRLQDIFLDIACFFIGWKKEEVIKIMETCYTFMNHNVEILKKRCLLTINEKDELGMHDLICHMGRRIARNINSNDHYEKHTRSWESNDIFDMMSEQKGTGAKNDAISSNSDLEVVWFNTGTFKRMKKLRLLYLKNVNITGSFEHAFEELRWLCWDRCPLECFPSEFHPQKLVNLALPRSKMRIMWEPNMVFENLKTLNMEHSLKLIITPNFTKLPCLESLNLKYCENLEEVHVSIGSLERLVFLNLHGCAKLTSIPNSICNLRVLRSLNIGGCGSLKALPSEFGKFQSLTERRVSLWEPNMVFKTLKTLNMKHSLELVTTPNFTKLPCLEMLSLEYCENLKEVHISIGSLKRLEFLNLCRCAKLMSIPNSICNLTSLTSLNIGGCSSLKALPSEFGNIQSLTELNAWGLTIPKLPDSMRRLSKLYDLNLSDNEYLENPSYTASDLSPTGWDVFLSMRGMDTRFTFTSHLYSVLNRHGLRVFMDDRELHSQEVLSPALSQAIQECKTYIVILSENYASSPWCLEELVEIVKCCKTVKKLVIPVFYHIDQLLVRHQTGSFKQAFEKHETRFAGEIEKVNKWRLALTEVAEFSGYHISKHRSEDDVVIEIVDEIIFEINPKALSVAKYPVRLDSRAKDITNLLSTGTEDIIKFGIYGVDGVGKTALAKALFNQLLLGGSFKGSCFLTKVGEVSQTFKGLESLQQKLINDVLKMKKKVKVHNIYEGTNLIQDSFCSTKVLIALDDLADYKQFKLLVGPFAPGSVVIVTTGDPFILDIIGVKPGYKYGVNVLDHAESLALFNRHAFGHAKPNKNLMVLSKDILHQAGGHPLALEVFGSHLSLQSEVGWKSYIEKLQRNPGSSIQEKLIISLDVLDWDDPMLKKMFLDIACFFVGREKEEVVKIMETYYSHVDNKIDILKKRCLLTINNRNELDMHHLLQDLGREIARNKSPDEPGKHSRLWVPEDISSMLKKHKGTEAVEGIIPRNQDALKGAGFSTKTFKIMKKLRFLYLKMVNLSGSFERIFEDLRWLCWDCCPMECLPSEFHPSKLVILELPHSKMRTMWNPNMVSHVFESLKTLNMSFSLHLAITPDFTKLPCLEFLNLECCRSLKEIDISIGSLVRLVSLNLHGCIELCTLPDTICQLGALKVLSISNCSSLEALPQQLGNLQSLKELNADALSVSKLPDSIGLLSELVELRLNYNMNLETLPKTIYDLSSLENLHLGYCINLQYIAELPLNLKWIRADGCTSLEKLPNLSNLKHLQELHLADCSSLNEILGLEESSIKAFHLRGCNSSLLAYITKSLYQVLLQTGETSGIHLPYKPDKHLQSVIALISSHSRNG